MTDTTEGTSVDAGRGDATPPADPPSTSAALPAHDTTAAAPMPGPTSAASSKRTWMWALFVVAVIALVAIRIFTIEDLLNSGIEQNRNPIGGDVQRYAAIERSPGTPYRDFDAEYPPVILFFFKAIDGPTMIQSFTNVAYSQLALELAIAGLLAWGWSKRAGVVYLVLGTPMCIYAFPYARTDLIPVFLVVAGLFAFRRQRPVAAGILIGIGFFAKLWPAALAGLFIATRHVRAFIAWALTIAVGAAAWLLWAGPSGFVQVFTFRGAKGWQIESLPGIVLHMIDPKDARVEGGAWRTAADVTIVGRLGLTLASAAVVALAWWWASRRFDESNAHPHDEPARERADLDLYGWAPLASVTALLVLSSIISPQYVLWIMPFLALAIVGTASHWVRWSLLLLGLGIAFLSAYSFLTIGAELAGELRSTGAVLVRNLMLLAVLLIAMWALRPAATKTEPVEP